MNSIKPLLFCLAWLTLTGCAGDGPEGTGVEVATTAFSGAAYSGEGTLAGNESRGARSLWGEFERLFLEPKAFANTLCPTRADATACNGGVSVLNLGTATAPCSSGLSWIYHGKESLTWNAPAACELDPRNGTAGTSYTRRTFDGGTTATPLTRTQGEYSAVLDTEDGSGYATPMTGGVTGGFVVTCTGNTCGTARTIAIRYAHYLGTFKGTPVWDHTVDTDVAKGGAAVVVSGSGATRVVQSGILHLQHNLAKIESMTTINGPLTYTADCCFPVSGSVTTAIKGGRWDGQSETLAYSSTCGEATLTDGKGKTSSRTLRHCL